MLKRKQDGNKKKVLYVFKCESQKVALESNPVILGGRRVGG